MFEWFGKVSYCPHTKVSDFARHLKDGRIMASSCEECGQLSFPPRADCSRCMSDKFTYSELSGEGTILSFTRIDAAPAGFDEEAPFIVGVVDLKETGRLLAWFGESIAEKDIAIGMPVQVVPQIFENTPEIKVYYSLEKLGTSWVKSNSA